MCNYVAGPVSTSLMLPAGLIYANVLGSLIKLVFVEKKNKPAGLPDMTVIQSNTLNVNKARGWKWVLSDKIKFNAQFIYRKCAWEDK